MSKTLLKRDYLRYVVELVSEHPADYYTSLLNFVQCNFGSNKELFFELSFILMRLFDNPYTNFGDLYYDYDTYKNELLFDSIKSTGVIQRLESADKGDFFSNYDYSVHDNYRIQELDKVSSTITFPPFLFGTYTRVDEILQDDFGIAYDSGNRSGCSVLVLLLLSYLIKLNNIVLKFEDQMNKEFVLSDEDLKSIYLRLGKLSFSSLSFEELERRQKLIDSIIKQSLGILEDKEQSTLLLQESSNTFNNVPIQTIREIFGVLTTKKNSVNPRSTFIDEKDLNEFIDCAFLGKELKQKINIRFNNQKDIIRLKHLFYIFKKYSNSYESRGKEYKNEDYANLFVNYFKTSIKLDSFVNNISKPPTQKDKILLRLEDIKEH